MIFLNSTSETLKVVTTVAADLDIQCNWIDVIPTTSATPNSTETKVTTATTTTIIAAPASSTTRQIKSISIRNVHATDANIFTITKDISGTSYVITSDITLQAGICLTYEDGAGWQIGSTLINTLTNDLHLGYQDWEAISNPTTPPSDTLRLYARKISGRTMPKWIPPSGLDTSFQPALFGNNIVLWQAGGASGVMIGSFGTAIAGGSVGAQSTTNKYTSLKRSVFTAGTGVNIMNSYRSDNMFFRGSVAGMGGFFFFCRFGLNVWTANNRFFVGLATDTTNLLTTTDPSAKLNLVGFGIDSADTAFSFIHNDSTGTAAKEPISGQPALATYNVYDAYIFCKPNDTTVYYRLDDLSTGTIIIDSSVSTELPLNTQMLNAVCAIGSGSNSGAGVASFGMNRMYIETDY